MALSLVAYLGSLWMLARAVGLSAWATIAFIVLGLLAGDTYLQVTSGLETGFALALVVGAIAAVIARRVLSLPPS